MAREGEKKRIVKMFRVFPLPIVRVVKCQYGVQSCPTVCPKVPYKSKVPIFSAKCGWILKPFGLLISPAGGFDLVYEVA